MMELASAWQLRLSLLRWLLVLVPGLLLLGIVSAQFAGGGAVSSWFAMLDKPPAFPPPALFELAWTLFYALIGLSLAIVMAARGAIGRGQAIVAYLVLVLLGLLWLPVFFAGHRLLAALVLIVLLDLATVATIVLAWRIRKTAALLLVPYLAFTAFATVLVWEVQRANGAADGRADSGAVTRIEF